MDEDFMGRSWSPPDKFVCPGCVADSFLKEKIAQNLAKRKCDYCGRGGRGNIAAPVAAIMEHIGPTFHYYYADPDHAGVPYDEGGYAISPNIRAEDGLWAINLKCHDVLFADIARSIGNDMLWVEASGGVWLGEHQNEFLSNEWKRFSQTIKHESRFFFSTLASTGQKFPSNYTPLEMLAEIGQMVSEMGMVQPWSAGTKLFRGRKREADATWPLDAKELGAPPNEKALTQRMNPAGISYFYLAKEQETVLAEVERSIMPRQIAMASFTLRRDLQLLDLANFPQIPSIFDQARRSEYESALFLISFANEISKPVKKDGLEHIEYIPSQIVSEYFAKIFRLNDGSPLDGMTYASAAFSGGGNIVLFPPQDSRGFGALANFSDPVLIPPRDSNCTEGKAGDRI